ncbi:flavin reductase [Thioclava sp. GXIMD2076]|uniref:flavin reductase n=1 Tax=unclassified Thioclava TaxID=2621713 RepID=UPI0030CA8355
MSDLADSPAATDLPIIELADKQSFRDGMSCLVGAVNIVTTDGPGGRAGFTATAVCSVTDEPPTLLVCVNRSSSAAPAFLQNDSICVNTVGPKHAEIAMLFGGKTPMQERFADVAWRKSARTGAPVLDETVATFDCKVSARQVVGTHEVIFCQVVEARSDATSPASAYFGRKFHELSA